MNNRAIKPQQAPALQIASRTFLVEADAGLPGRVGRQLRFTTGERQFLAIQPADIGAASDLALCSDIGDFCATLGLGATDATALLGMLFRLVVPSFRLESEPSIVELAGQVGFVAARRTARVHAHRITGQRPLVLRMPASLGVASGNAVIALSATKVVSGTLLAVAPVLGEDADDHCLGVVQIDLPTGADHLILFHDAGIARLDLVFADHKNLTEFMMTVLREDPDALSVLSIADSGVAAELGLLSRKVRSHPEVDEPYEAFRFGCEVAVNLPHGLFVSGWFLDPETRLGGVMAIDHGLCDANVGAHWHLFDGRGEFDGKIEPVKRFAAFLPRQHGAPLPALLQIRLELDDGRCHLIRPTPVASDLLSRRKAILSTIADHAFDTALFSQVYEPAVASLQAAINARQSVRSRHEFGQRSDRRVSIIVPLYGELGFVRSQLGAFEADGYVRDHCEIVYVLDDPALATATRTMLRGYGMIHRLDIRLIILDRNGGYASANNTGVEEAEGASLVLMNSDVVPERAGWLEPLVDRLSALPAFSVVGPKLLYGDGSLQHAGMYFLRMSTEGHWQNLHYWKGYGRDFAPACVEREVPAVTGALMVLRADAYRAVGGFTDAHITGDYEDSDLCLKLRQRGGVCHYVPSSVLYHFERQSMPEQEGEGDLPSTLYNRARHSHYWNDDIAALMKRFEEVHVAL